MTVISKTRHNTKPLIRWVGSKLRLMRKFIPLFPNHRRYVSVFGGSGADIIGKSRSHEEVYNDLSKDLVNYYYVIRDDLLRKQLCRRFNMTPYSRYQFSQCVDLVIFSLTQHSICLPHLQTGKAKG